MFKISSYLQSRVVGFLAVRKKYVLSFFVLFTFWLFNSCHEQTGKAEKGAPKIDSSAANEAVTEHDSLAWADSLFANKQALAPSSVFSDTLVASRYLEEATRLGDNSLYDDSNRYYRRAISIYEKSGHWEGVIECLYSLARNKLYQGRFEQAEGYLFDALRLTQKYTNSDHLAKATIFNLLGNLYVYRGQYDKALEWYEQTAFIYSKILNNHPKLYAPYNNIAIIYYQQTNYAKALEYFEKSLSLIQGREDLVSVIAQLYHNIAAIYFVRKEFRRNIECLEKAILINLRRKGFHDLAYNYANIAETYIELRNYRKALEYAQEALTLFKQTLHEPHLEIAQAYEVVAEIYTNIGDFITAKKYYRQVIRIKRRLDDAQKTNIIKTYVAIGNTFLHQSELDSVFFYAKKANNLIPDNLFKRNISTLTAELTYYNREVLELLLLRANGRYKQYLADRERTEYLQASTKLMRLAIDFISQLRMNYDNQQSKILLYDLTYGVFESALQRTYELHQLIKQSSLKQSAFNIVEQSKSTILRDQMHQSNAKTSANIPDDLLAQEKKLRDELTNLDINRGRQYYENGHADSLKITEIEDRFFALKRKYENLIKLFETEYPNFYKLKYNTKVASVAEVQEALDENTLLLEYFYGDSAIYIFTLDKDSFEIVSVEKGEKLDQQIRSFRKAIIESDYALFAEKGRTLYRILLAPVAQYLEKKQLLIIPDGPLNYLPFEALLTRDINGAEMDFSNLPYLLNQYSVSYHYSATLWLETTLRKREKEPIYDYVAFAPVNWDSTVASNAVFATLTANRALDSTRALPINLLSTRQEVLDIEAQFNEKYNLFASLLNRFTGNRTRVFLDDEATEVAAKHYNLEDYRYIHFATHGFANTAAPTLSGLLLADRKDSTALEDGVLRLGEVYNLKLNADLVVLSACETGYGKLLRGEGLLSLTRGFIYAGAKNLVVSLWQVDANSPSELMPKFFKGVLKGEAKNAALRDAKLRLIQSGSAYVEPKHWAPFVLIGQ